MKWYTHVGDFANLLKAFIGSNYLGVSFAFYQSGLGLGIIGLVFIASLTDHCCNLIVKTKYRAIKNHIAGLKVQGQSNKSYSATSDSEDVSENEIEYDFDEISEQEEHMIRHMSYGDVGWNAFGKMGLYTVNIFIAMTQFGFCVSYFIFIGNTVYSLFPVTYCDNSLSRSNSSSDNIYPFCRDVTLQSINHHDRVNQTVLYPKVTAQLLEKKFDNFEYDSNYTTPSSFNISTTENSSLTTPFTSTITTHSTVTTTNSSKDTTIFISTTTATNISEISSIVQQSTAPSLKLLVAAPLPIMILFAMIRTIRNLSFISLTASISIFTGCIAVFTYIIIDFEVHPDVRYFNWAGFPVFYGLLSGAFEGIGLVIPVESSMEGNRHKFSSFLHGVVFILSFILGCFGMLGYLRFGSEVNQMLNTNIPATTWVAVAVNICVLIGVLLTFPMQMYPVTEMIEILLFSHGSICGPKKNVDQNDQEDSLLPKEAPDLVKSIPKEVSQWKRNFVRLIVVCATCGLAVIFKNSFAYIGAFTEQGIYYLQDHLVAHI